MKLVDSSSEPTPVDATATAARDEGTRTRPRSTGRCDARAVKALVAGDALRDELEALFGEDPDLAS